MLAMDVNDDAGASECPWCHDVLREHARSYKTRRCW